MKNWEKFESESLLYIQKEFGNLATFVGVGSHDSTVSDIKVIKDGETVFFIESKDSLAQCGQFVLEPDYEKRLFVYSRRNKSSYENARIIVEYMNAHFENYAPKVNGEKYSQLDLNQEICFNWVKKYYREEKKCEYFITMYEGDFVISHISNIDKYFEISAAYRRKTSGSCKPAKRNIPEIKRCLIKNGIVFRGLNNDTFEIDIVNKDVTFKLKGESYRYQFTKIGEKFKITRLSNTRNWNVIFTLHAKSPQRPEDIEMLKKDLK